MLIEFLFAMIIGLIAGTFTGLAPGIHINLISGLIISSISLNIFSSIPVIYLVIFIVSMSITHTFLDFLPSIYLGAPEEESFLSILPGHKMLKEGHAHEAFIITLYGCLIAIPLILILTPIFIFVLPSFFNLIKEAIPFILIFVSLFLILREDKPSIALLVFFLSGALGYFTFNLPVKQPLMPLLTGLFGLSSLFISLKEKPKMNIQKTPSLKEIKLKKGSIRSIVSAFISAPLCSFLPGIGSGHAAVIASEISNNNEQINPRSFLLMLGIINMIVMSLSFVTAYSIQKTRTGSAAAVQSILTKITFNDLIIILITIIISAVFAFLIGIKLSKIMSKIINKINYKYLTITILFMLIIFNFIFSNLLGLIILIISSCIGIFTILSNSKRINMMGCLILPSIIYYLIN